MIHASGQLIFWLAKWVSGRVLKTKFRETSLEKFLEVCNKVLDKHVPRKSKFVQGNHSPFMNQELSKKLWEEQDFGISSSNKKQ